MEKEILMRSLYYGAPHTHSVYMCAYVCVCSCMQTCTCHFNFSTTRSVFIKLGRGKLKCDGTRTETRFHLSVKWTSPLNR